MNFIPLTLYAAAVVGSWPEAVNLRLGTEACTQGPVFQAQVADTSMEKMVGLSRRPSPLASNEAMLFVWEQPTPVSFWMKDTWIPLTILYFDPVSNLLSIQEMTVEADPQRPERRYPESRDVLAAVEIQGGNLICFASNTDLTLCIES